MTVEEDIRAEALKAAQSRGGWFFPSVTGPILNAALPDWQFLVEDSTGRVTKAKGRHKMTEVAEENYRKITPPIPRSTDPVGDKAKGALDGFSCGKFTLARG